MHRPAFFLLTAVAAVTLSGGAGPVERAKKPAKPRFTNRLAKETSPYLLMHAHNPVDWYPWGPEAFAKARKEKKLVFLSIGYSSCYWCHVMERESFANAEVAKLLHKDFVCIKVDREERPDIDTVYMTALQVLDDRGGWPLSMFLTAEGKPIIGFTYRPPDDRVVNGRRVALGFKSILKFVRKWQGEKPKELAGQADEVAARTRRALAQSALGVALVELDAGLVTGAVEELREGFDKEYGGFGSPKTNFRGTKFPTSPALAFLADQAGRGNQEAAEMLTRTLDRMAGGGIYDQLGGGFHRYSTERTWTIPHFEKMLYDNAQLVEVYARAFRLTKKPPYRRIIRETLEFVRHEMTSPEGGFYSALDAETGGEEGRFYVWTDAEIKEALPESVERSLARRVYGMEGGYNFESKYHVMTFPKPLPDIARDLKLPEEQMAGQLEPVRKKLFDARARRPRPFLDKKILTGWNGQMIAGYAVAGKVLGEQQYVAAAARAANLVLQRLRTPDGRLLRTYAARPGHSARARIGAYLDDYGYLVHGLLCLHDATGQTKWLNEARRLTDTMLEYHSDRYRAGFFHQERERGGLFYTANDQEKLFARAKDQFDGAQPSGNSMAVRNLVRLARKTGDMRYRALARLHLKAFAGTLKSSPGSMTTMVEALAMYLGAKKRP
jgi:uncharacterized protein YyaL (SSP411 family)